MKKYYGWIILTGILSGAVFKEPCFGSFFGLLVAVIIGIPLFLFLSWLPKIFVNSNEKVINRIALSFSVSFIIAIHWFFFQPPGWLVFRTNISNPPPASVKNIHRMWLWGLFDVPTYVKFEIDKTDLDKIIAENKYEIVEFDGSMEDNFRNNKWFNIEDIKKNEVYCLETKYEVADTFEYHSEYIIYNPKTKQAFYSSFW